MAKRLQWLFAFLTLIAGGIFVYAQNPVSISQIGTTPVTTTIPVSGTFWQATQPVSGTFWQATQPISAASLPLPTGAATETTLGGVLTTSDFDSKAGSLTETAPATDTASSGLNGRLQRIAQRLTTLLAVFPTTLTLNSGAADASTLRTATDLVRVGGVAISTGNGVAGTGVTRVDVASDNTAFETIPVSTASTTNGLSTCYLTSAASTNSTNCKASAGNVYAIHVTNTTTTNYFLRLYNSSSAPTCSSATGFIETVPALGASANGGVNGRINGAPQAYATGIGFCLTGGGSSTDNTNAATGVYITIEYK